MNSTSYFSAPANTLDPTLFEGRNLRSWVRSGIQSILNDFLGQRFRHSELWAHPWLAGSAVSYQWSANRTPGDLDCLIGINPVQFRKANPEFAGLTDKEISAELNEQFHDLLHGQTEDWNGFELTFYALTTDDIRNIKPYAAYDLKFDEWTVYPDPNQQAPRNDEWDAIADSDYEKANQAETRFNMALQDVQTSQGGPTRRNAEVKMTAAAVQASALYNEIHENRSVAFSPTGQGYGDFNNYRWQAGKKNGTVQKLRSVRHAMRDSLSNGYGAEMPDASTMVRRAATYRNTL